jgi:hypothetical protein
MLKSYQARLVQGQLLWTEETPPVVSATTAAHVIVTFLQDVPAPPPNSSHNPHCPLAGSVLAYDDPLAAAVPPQTWECL